MTASILLLVGSLLSQEHEHGAATQDGGLRLPMTREASGTSWQPDSTPMRAYHFMEGEWSLMLHGNVFVGYDFQSTRRGGDQWLSTNWLMFMAGHPLAGGDLTFRTMLSPEPATIGRDGYPLLLQTGEAVGGQPLHDVQHPHDLFMEVAALYQHPLSDQLGIEVYAAPSGEPALGPSGFPHRLSAMLDPLAPLGHHWQDSTHISFGVVTGALSPASPSSKDPGSTGASRTRTAGTSICAVPTPGPRAFRSIPPPT